MVNNFGDFISTKFKIALDTIYIYLNTADNRRSIIAFNFPQPTQRIRNNPITTQSFALFCI